MKLRADQALMIGVAGLGLWFGWRLFSGKASSSAEPLPQGPAPKPAAQAFTPLPNAQPSLKANVDYYGRIDLDRKPTPAEIAALIAPLGLANVTVFETQAEAANVIPPIRYVLDAPGPGTVWFQGRATKTGVSTRIPGITYVWIAT